MVKKMEHGRGVIGGFRNVGTRGLEGAAPLPRFLTRSTFYRALSLFFFHVLCVTASLVALSTLRPPLSSSFFSFSPSLLCFLLFSFPPFISSFISSFSFIFHVLATYSPSQSSFTLSLFLLRLSFSPSFYSSSSSSYSASVI